MVEADLQDIGIDVGDDVFMRSRSWRWLRVRIDGLLLADTRVSRHFRPNDERSRQ